MKQESKLFKWNHFEGIIIMWLVRWYGRYALSYAYLKEMAAERGLKIERSTICRWVHEYGAMLAKLTKPLLKSLSCAHIFLSHLPSFKENFKLL